ncbi:hypothetical protein AAHA92_10222 [Salvia divinorum]|uniref:Uncharacterized protein n=1 Tax=Salvia divinorum TaxID=28513 RepID=A0ABD1HVA5_SALDI
MVFISGSLATLSVLLYCQKARHPQSHYRKTNSSWLTNWLYNKTQRHSNQRVLLDDCGLSLSILKQSSQGGWLTITIHVNNGLYLRKWALPWAMIQEP